LARQIQSENRDDTIISLIGASQEGSQQFCCRALSMIDLIYLSVLFGRYAFPGRVILDQIGLAIQMGWLEHVPFVGFKSVACWIEICMGLAAMWIQWPTGSP